MAELEAERVVHVKAKPFIEPSLLAIGTPLPATLLLLHLVAQRGIDQITGEIGIQVEIGIQHKGVEVIFPIAALAPGVGGNAVAVADASVCRGTRLIKIPPFGLHSVQGDLVSRGPGIVVSLAEHGHPPIAFIQGPAQHPVEFLCVLGGLPDTIVILEFAGVEQCTPA